MSGSPEGGYESPGGVVVRSSVTQVKRPLGTKKRTLYTINNLYLIIYYLRPLQLKMSNRVCGPCGAPKPPLGAWL